MASVYRLYGARDLVLDREEVASGSLAPNEFFAETHYTAVSPGTEVSAYLGLPGLRPGSPYPRLVGYCNAARVARTGSEVTALAVGDWILSFQSHRSSFVGKDSGFWLKLDPKADGKQAATTYLFHLGYHALLSARARSSERVAVIGVGTLGFTCLKMSRVIGCRSTGFTEQSRLLSKLQGHNIALERKSAPSRISAFDVVVNTSNLWEDWKLALELVNEGGRIVNVGFPGRGVPTPDFNPLDPQFVYAKSVSILPLCPLPEFSSPGGLGGVSIAHNCEYLLELVALGRLCPADIISAEANYQDLKSVYESYADRSGPLFSTVLCWRDPC